MSPLFRVLAASLLLIALPAHAGSRKARREPAARERPTGLVTITLGDFARVYWEGHRIGEVAPNQPWTIVLPAGQRHRLRFRNPAHGLDFVREFEVRKNTQIKIQFTVRHLWVRS